MGNIALFALAILFFFGDAVSAFLANFGIVLP